MAGRVIGRRPPLDRLPAHMIPRDQRSRLHQYLKERMLREYGRMNDARPVICEVRDNRTALVRRAFSPITRDHTLGCPFPCLTNDKQEGVSEACASIHSGLSRSRAYPVPCITPRATMKETHRLPRCPRGCYRRSKGRNAERRASSGSDGLSHEAACPSHVRVGTTTNGAVAISTGQTRRATPRFCTHLEPLLHLLDKHVSVRRKAVDREHGAISSVYAR